MKRQALTDITLHPDIEQFLRYIRSERRLSDNTVGAYRSDLAQWQLFATDGGKYDLAPATASVNDLRLWVAHSVRAGISQRSVRRKVQALRAFYHFMMRRRGMTANPASEIQLARLPQRLPVYARTEEVNAMIDEPYDHTDFVATRNHLVVALLYNTGIRCSELTSLLDANINTDRGELKVHGKRNKDRIVPFGPELAAEIELYRALRHAAIPTCLTPELMVEPSGMPLKRHKVYALVKKAMTAAGVHATRRSPHVLRHSFATDMLNNGADINAVQHLLGHESLETTQLYTHVTFSDLLNNYQSAHPRGATNLKKPK